MANQYYYMQVPDYRDLDNRTGKRPGYKASIVEKDGGIGIMIEPVDAPSNIDNSYSIFLNVNEAKVFQETFKEAYESAKEKNKDGLAHPNRAKPLRFVA